MVAAISTQNERTKGPLGCYGRARGPLDGDEMRGLFLRLRLCGVVGRFVFGVSLLSGGSLVVHEEVTTVQWFPDPV